MPYSLFFFYLFTISHLNVAECPSVPPYCQFWTFHTLGKELQTDKISEDKELSYMETYDERN